jgi:radical SAM protein with 4Fe4S-binding SPASM domain
MIGHPGCETGTVSAALPETAVERRETGFALGVGFTNACNLSCGHCYRPSGVDQLRAKEVLRAVDAVPTRAVNFGTGENGLHPEFPALVAQLLERGIRVTMTTNGLSAAVLPDALLARFCDVELSIDFPTREGHDAAREAGNWDLVEAQMERCARLGVPTAIVAVLMRPNARDMPELAGLAASRGAALRVNVYQPVNDEALAPSFEEFWEAWRALLEVADLSACSEPIVRAVLGLPASPAGCGAQTIRLSPRGRIVPCVYAPAGGLALCQLEELGAAVVDHPSFRALRRVPEVCRSCPHLETCGGGCPSRRRLRGGLDRPDEYCPFVRGARVQIAARLQSGRDMPKASSACTTILRARDAPRPSG